MDRRLQNAHSRQASVEVERQVNDRASVSVGYHYLRGDGLLMAINRNVPSCVPSGTNNGCRPNPEYGNKTQYSSAGESDYHGLLSGEFAAGVRPGDGGRGAAIGPVQWTDQVLNSR